MGHLVMQTTLAVWRKGCSAEVQVMELKPAFAAWSAFWLDEQGWASSVCHSPRCHSSIAVSCTGGPWGISSGVTEWPTDRARAKNRQVSDTYQTNRPWMREEEEERDRPTFPSLKGTHPAHYPGFALQCFTVMIHTLFSVCFSVEVTKVKTRPVGMLNKSDLPKQLKAVGAAMCGAHMCWRLRKHQ